MMLGEVSPGGVGAGLYGMLIFALLAVFIAGLMVGPHPGVPRQEDPGHRDEAGGAVHPRRARSWCSGFTGASVLLDSAAASILSGHQGTPHGLTEVTYAFTSAGNNNGSAFGGLTGATDWYNTTLGLSMLVGRFFLIVPALAIAGSLARKQADPPVRRHLPHRRARSSAVCWSASCSSSSA